MFGLAQRLHGCTGVAGLAADICRPVLSHVTGRYKMVTFLIDSYAHLPQDLSL